MVEGWGSSCMDGERKEMTEIFPGVLSSGCGLLRAVGVSSNDQLITRGHVLKDVGSEIRDCFKEVLIMTGGGSVEGHKQDRVFTHGHSNASKTFMCALNGGDVGVDAAVPTYGCAMPGWSRL